MPHIVIVNPCQAETGGGQWRAGGTYPASDSYAKALIGRGDAYDPAGGIEDIGNTGLVGDGLAPGSYGDIIAVGNPTTGLNISSSVLSAAARTVADDATVADMVNTLGGASSTGTGGLVRATSPTLVTPILGTPQSVTLTNGTGLPVTTGLSGMGSNVAAFLATPSSANLRAALTDETGTGAAVFANSPTLVTPALGTPSSGVLTNCTGLPVASVVGLTTVATDTIFNASGDLVVGTGSDTAARLAIGANGNVLRSNGTTAAWAALAASDIAISDAGGYFPGSGSVEAALQVLGATMGADIKVHYLNGATAAAGEIVWLGASVALDFVLDSFPSAAWVELWDNTTNAAPALLARTTNGTGSTLTNYVITVGAAPFYGVASTAILLVVSGTVTGRLHFRA
jgi:hypothetical protein